jgi:hypothetical protein
VRSAALELRQVNLADALAIVLLISIHQDPPPNAPPPAG